MRATHNNWQGGGMPYGKIREVKYNLVGGVSDKAALFGITSELHATPEHSPLLFITT